MRFLIWIMIMGWASMSTPIHGQVIPPPLPPKLNVFLDCDNCDFSFFRQEFNAINYVRDREQAEVHVLVTRQGTGSGGQEFKFEFIGREAFESVKYTLTTYSPQSDSGDDLRKRLLHTLKSGLVTFLHEKVSPEMLTIDIQSANGGSEPNTPFLTDPWNYWVYQLTFGTRIEGEESQNEYSIWGSLNASRTTEEWKFYTFIYLDYDEETFEEDSTSYTNLQRYNEWESGIIYSINPHWSTGFFWNNYMTTYRNTDLMIQIAPAIEYNFFPWKESNKREWTLAYYLGMEFHDYTQKTIFGKTDEILAVEALEMNVKFEQPWGEIDAGIQYLHYFHDLSKYKIEVETLISIRMSEGLSFETQWNFDSIHDQLYLAAGNASTEEILLQRRQLATTYDFYFRVGLSYTFGSIYNNVVNPRL